MSGVRTRDRSNGKGRGRAEDDQRPELLRLETAAAGAGRELLPGVTGPRGPPWNREPEGCPAASSGRPELKPALLPVGG